MRLIQRLWGSWGLGSQSVVPGSGPAGAAQPHPPAPRPAPPLRGMLSAAGPGGVLDLAPTCSTPAYKAAEDALLSKLGAQAAGCLADYAALEALNEAAMRQHSISDALANRDCNRYTDVLPYDHSRARLQHVPPGGRDYLNASHLFNLREGDGPVPWHYIVAQGPLDHTREAFWQLVSEQRCSAVIMLTNCVERNIRKCARYFPTQPATKKSFGHFTVKTATAEEVAPDLCRRSLLVVHSGGGGGGGGAEKHLVAHYHYAAWPDHGVPASPLPLLHICEHLRQSRAHDRPILVHCSAGIGRSGVFCVLDIVTRRLLQLAPDDAAGGTQAVDVVGLVGRMRQQRMGMVQTRDQYVFCHTALLEFVRRLDVAAGARAGAQP